MFCMSCGKELPNEARFCLHCGTQQATNTLPAAVATPQPALSNSNPNQPPKFSTSPTSRPARPMLTDYHVSDWEGECPSCNLVSTHETCRCVNDNSAIVVAFRSVKRPAFSRLPLYAADLRCLNDCGLKVQAFPCPQCGAVIKGRYLRFRFPESVRNLHRLYHIIFRLVWVGLLAVTLVCGYTLFEDFQVWGSFNHPGFPRVSPPSELLYPFLGQRACIFPFALFFVLWSRNMWTWYRGRGWFDFTDVAKSLERHEKAKRISEAVETAKATQAATQPFKFGS